MVARVGIFRPWMIAVVEDEGGVRLDGAFQVVELCIKNMLVSFVWAARVDASGRDCGVQIRPVLRRDSLFGHGSGVVAEDGKTLRRLWTDLSCWS